ncbi:MAG: PIN domain-containing protein [Dehalococcoidia bacterium]
MSDIVLDASAALAVVREEPGSDVVLQALAEGTGFISAVNLSEAISILIDRGMTHAEASLTLGALELAVIPFTESRASAAAALRAATRALGLGLGDRACLALGIEMGLPVLSGDRAWSRVDLGIQVKLIRP